MITIPGMLAVINIIIHCLAIILSSHCQDNYKVQSLHLGMGWGYFGRVAEIWGEGIPQT